MTASIRPSIDRSAMLPVALLVAVADGSFSARTVTGAAVLHA